MIMNKLRNKTRGFTLVELLVVTLILGVVTAAIGACIAGGIRAWESVRNFNALELNVLPALEIFEKELRNSIEFFGIDFEGADQELKFAEIIRGSDAGSRLPRIGTVRYFFNATHGTVLRKAWAYPEDEPDKAEVMMSRISGMDLDYFYVMETPAGNVGEWDDFRERGTNLVHGVKIHLEYRGPGGQTHEISRVITMPVGIVRREQLAGVEAL